jgi:hypothetical protein
VEAVGAHVDADGGRRGSRGRTFRPGSARNTGRNAGRVTGLGSEHGRDATFARWHDFRP